MGRRVAGFIAAWYRHFVMELDDSPKRTPPASGKEGSSRETDDAADLLRRHRESLFPSVGLFYDEPIELRWGGELRELLGGRGPAAALRGRLAQTAPHHALGVMLNAAKHLGSE
jgi:hypothetical protein